MEKKWYYSKTAKCPYYKRETTQVIYCEGVMPGTVLHLAFADKGHAKDFKAKMCRCRYELCPVKKMIDREVYDAE